MASTSTANLLIRISEQYTVYVSFIILFGGICGQIINIFVFTQLKIFQGNPSVFYIITESIVNLLQMMISFTSRIAINGFSNDLTRTSLFWCKLRQYLLQDFTPISLNIVCLASIDQYLSTSYYPFLRQMSNIKSAKMLTGITIIFWILHGIPFAIYFEIQPTFGCYVYNQYFLNYITYFNYLVLSGVLPMIVSGFFSILAYRNVRRLVRRQLAVRRRKLDQQLTAMIFSRVIFLIVTVLPYAIQRSYELSTYQSKEDFIEKAIIQLIAAVSFSLFYLNYSGSFYLFLISSVRFRRQVKHIFIHKIWRVYCRKNIRNNQVGVVALSFNSDLDLQ